MDAAGKDGAIRHVMSGRQSAGLPGRSASSIPSGVELEHDFLWRTTRELPERGMIGIFNRSYYEERPDPARPSRDCCTAEGFPTRREADGDSGARAIARSSTSNGICRQRHAMC